MKRMITIGETMVSFVPQITDPLKYGPMLRMKIAGAESNTAIGMQHLGIASSFVTKLGADPFGQFILRMVRAEGIDTSGVTEDPEHSTGLLFKDPSTHTDTSVYYYRKDSAAAHMTPEDLPHEKISGSDLLHLTGITPVLSASCRETVEQAISDAAAGGCRISFDPNIRYKLWKDRDYTEGLLSIARRSHCLLLGLEEAERLYGTRDVERIRDAVFDGGVTQYLAIKNGGSGAWVSDADQILEIPPYPCHCIDPVGAGDAFNAGFLTGILKGDPLSRCGTVAAITGAKATESFGDIEGFLTEQEINNLLNHVTLTNR